MINTRCVVISAVVGAFSGVAPAWAQETPESSQQAAASPSTETKAYYAGGAEGATLPSRVLRLRTPMQFASAKSGFDGEGKKKDLGLDLSLMGAAFVAEYGITDSISLQFLMPYVTMNRIGMDADTFRKSKDYKDNYAKFVGSVSLLLQSKGLCTSTATCTALVESGYSLPTTTSVTLPTGETLTVGTNRPVKEYIDSLIVNYAEPKYGKTGIGDIEVGALWNPVSPREPVADLPIFFSAGLGIRFPTGAFEDVTAAYRAPGRGTLDLGLRTNLDFKIMNGVWINLQNQSEYMLASGKKKKTSMLDNTKANTADATTSDARFAGGDGKGNTQKFERRGLRNVGFVKAGLGWGLVDQMLAPLGTNVQFKYDMAAQEYLDGKKQADPSRGYSLQFGASLDGLAYAIPLQFDVDYSIPVAGKNQTLAASVLATTVKLYYKF